MQHDLDIQGHRGCRGILPENTVAAFLHAIELGVSTLEMDVVVSKDRKLIVSHDPYMRFPIMSHPDGSRVSLDEEHKLKLWEMDEAHIQNYPTGLLEHPDFPEQLPIKGFKPSLAVLLGEIEAFCKENELDLPFLNIEIKSREEWDDIMHPDILVYAKIAAGELLPIAERYNLTLQSFDARMINAMRAIAPELRFYFLVDKAEEDLDAYLEPLVYEPYGLSPHYDLVNEDLVKTCAARAMEMAVWTVNELEEAQRLVEKGVTRIITDYPDLINKWSLAPEEA